MKQYLPTLTDFINESYISPVKMADELVKAGVINKDYTDLSGKKASSKLSFIISKIMDDIKESAIKEESLHHKFKADEEQYIDMVASKLEDIRRQSGKNVINSDAIMNALIDVFGDDEKLQDEEKFNEIIDELRNRLEPKNIRLDI